MTILNPPAHSVSGQGFQPDAALGTTILEWDGVNILRVRGDESFHVEVKDRRCLARIIFMLACPEREEALGSDCLRDFADQVLAEIADQPFIMLSDAVGSWLKVWQRERRTENANH